VPLLDYRLERKWSTIGFCSGAIAGLVAITPAAGYVAPWSAFVIGLVGAIVCNFATKVKFLLHVDDALDIFCHSRHRGCRRQSHDGAVCDVSRRPCPQAAIR
jgi:ammonia channel protein AmtB